MNNSELKTGDLVEVYSSDHHSDVIAIHTSIKPPMEGIGVGAVGVVLNMCDRIGSWIPVLFADSGRVLWVQSSNLRAISTPTDEEEFSNTIV